MLTIRGYKKQETKRQSVLCLNIKLKTIFKTRLMNDLENFAKTIFSVK